MFKPMVNTSNVYLLNGVKLKKIKTVTEVLKKVPKDLHNIEHTVMSCGMMTFSYLTIKDIRKKDKGINSKISEIAKLVIVSFHLKI